MISKITTLAKTAIIAECTIITEVAPIAKQTARFKYTVVGEIFNRCVISAWENDII